MKHKCEEGCFYFPQEIKHGLNCIFNFDRIKELCKKYKCGYNGEMIKISDGCKYYTPSSSNIPKLILFLGKSAAGKDTAINYLVGNYGSCFESLVSYTTRPMRSGETQDKEYHFISVDEFKKAEKKNEFADKRVYRTLFEGKSKLWRYGIKTKDITKENDKILLSAVDIDGYYNLSQKIDRKDLLVIYIDTKDGIREGRAKVRGSFSQTEWDRRLKDDNLKFTTTEMENISDYIVTNDKTIEEFYEKIEKCLRNEVIL